MSAEVFELETVVICDDIRQENNGKLFLIGAYTANILVASFPASFPLRALIITKPGTEAPHSFALEWNFEGTTLATLGANQERPDEEGVGIALMLPAVPLSFPTAGLLKLEIIAGDKRQTVIAKRLEQSSVPPRI